MLADAFAEQAGKAALQLTVGYFDLGHAVGWTEAPAQLPGAAQDPQQPISTASPARNRNSLALSCPAEAA